MRGYTRVGEQKVLAYEMGPCMSARKCAYETCATILFFIDNGCGECGFEFLPAQCNAMCREENFVCSKHKQTYRCNKCTKKRKIKM